MGMYDVILNPTKEDIKQRAREWVCLVNPELQPIIKLLREVDESHYHEVKKFLEDIRSRF